MFWGLIMEPNKRYTQTVEKPFHISQAAMDTSTGNSESCQVMVVVDGKNFLICTLQKNGAIQVPLDLYFKTGNVISFLTNGKSNVHLTGYLDPEFDDDEEAEEEEEDEEAPELVPAKGKRKLDAGVESNAKKLKQEAKKLLQKEAEESDEDEEEQEDGDDDDEDDSSDGDDDLQKLLDGDADSDENDDSFRPNSTGADSEDDSDEQGDTTLNTTSEADTSKEEPKKLSKSQKRRLKKLQKKEQEGQPQTNGVDKKSKKEKEQPKQKEGKKENKVADNKQAPVEKREKKSLSGGVFIEDLKVGSGPVAKAGKEVEVYYEGRLKQNNKMFDSCNKGPGFKFRVGHKEVISGWDVGIAGMKVGGKRKIVCPPAMAYGNKGSPPVIPPNSTLVFEVELKKVK